MLGDKILVKSHHTKAAEGVYYSIRARVIAAGRVAISVAGESGCGKSEVASEIARLFLEKDNMRSIILHQDDYFIRPPNSNDEVRRDDIKNVGMREVRMDLMDEHIDQAKRVNSREQYIDKPLIDYDNNKILEEKVDVNNIGIVLAEGTYTTALNNIDIRVFIDRTYIDTLEHRKERGRDMLDDYTEKILEIEHEIISAYRKKADIIISKDYNAEKRSKDEK